MREVMERENSLVDGLKKVRRAFAHKYNAREISIIDALIGPADPQEELAALEAPPCQ